MRYAFEAARHHLRPLTLRFSWCERQTGGRPCDADCSACLVAMSLCGRLVVPRLSSGGDCGSGDCGGGCPGGGGGGGGGVGCCCHGGRSDCSASGQDSGGANYAGIGSESGSLSSVWRVRSRQSRAAASSDEAGEGDVSGDEYMDARCAPPPSADAWRSGRSGQAISRSRVTSRAHLGRPRARSRNVSALGSSYGGNSGGGAALAAAAAAAAVAAEAATRPLFRPPRVDPWVRQRWESNGVHVTTLVPAPSPSVDAQALSPSLSPITSSRRRRDDGGSTCCLDAAVSRGSSAATDEDPWTGDQPDQLLPPPVPSRERRRRRGTMAHGRDGGVATLWLGGSGSGGGRRGHGRGLARLLSRLASWRLGGNSDGRIRSVSLARCTVLVLGFFVFYMAWTTGSGAGGGGSTLSDGGLAAALAVRSSPPGLSMWAAVRRFFGSGSGRMDGRGGGGTDHDSSASAATVAGRPRSTTVTAPSPAFTQPQTDLLKAATVVLDIQEDPDDAVAPASASPPAEASLTVVLGPPLQPPLLLPSPSLAFPTSSIDPLPPTPPPAAPSPSPGPVPPAVVASLVAEVLASSTDGGASAAGSGAAAAGDAGVGAGSAAGGEGLSAVPSEGDDGTTGSVGGASPASVAEREASAGATVAPSSLLRWDHAAVHSRTLGRHVVGLGTKHDHIVVHKPLCVNPTSEKVIFLDTGARCSGYNQTAMWLQQYCPMMQQSCVKEALLPISSRPRGPSWLAEAEAAGNVDWVEAPTVVQFMEKNCGNIAHYAGRALMLEHVIANAAAYVGADASRGVENVLLLPSWHVMKRFTLPHNYGFWHKSLLAALVGPARLRLSTLDRFVAHARKPYVGKLRVHLVHNLTRSAPATTAAGASPEAPRLVCFRTAITPSFLKARFFVDDAEYPSAQLSLPSIPVEGAPRVPRDAVRVRSRVHALLHPDAPGVVANGGLPTPPPVAKRVVFIDRFGARRALGAQDKEHLTGLLAELATAKGFTFEKVAFDNMTFDEQVATMATAAMAVGIHGANLVNSAFMPANSVLVELFPYRFTHDMYVEGGHAGVRYFSHQMLTGTDFPTLPKYRTAARCILRSHDCKVHYRDSALVVTDADLAELRSKFSAGFKFLHEVAKLRAVVKVGGKRGGR